MIGAVGAIFAVILILFPNIREVRQQAWVQSQFTTAFLSIILGMGLIILFTHFVYPYFIKVQPNNKDTSNLLVNGDFEQSIYEKRWDWSDSAEVTWDSGFSGKGLCIIQKTTEAQNNPAWAIIYQRIQVTPSKQYRFTGYMKWVNATQAHLKVDWYTADDKWIYEDFLSQKFDGTSDGWILQNKTVTAPADAKYASIVALHGVENYQTNVPGGSLCVDQIVLEPVLDS